MTLARPDLVRLTLPLDLTPKADIDRYRALMNAKGFDADLEQIQYTLERWMDDPRGATALDHEFTDEEAVEAIIDRMERAWRT